MSTVTHGKFENIRPFECTFFENFSVL